MENNVKEIWQEYMFKTECGELLIEVRDWNYSDKRNYTIKITDDKNREYILEVPNSNKYH
jgi:hypothetical protein